MTHSLIKALHSSQYVKFTYALCRMRRPRGSLFGQCVSAFIYSAYRPLIAATKLAHLNKHKVAF